MGKSTIIVSVELNDPKSPGSQCHLLGHVLHECQFLSCSCGSSDKFFLLLSQLHTRQKLFTCGVHAHVLPQNYMELDTPLSLSQEVTSDSTKKNDGIGAIAVNTSWFIWRTGRWLELFTNSQKLFLHVTTYDMAVCLDTRSPNHCYPLLSQSSFFFLVYGMDEAHKKRTGLTLCVKGQGYTIPNIHQWLTSEFWILWPSMHGQINCVNWANLLILCHNSFS